MAQKDVELILIRRWASMLAMPVFLVGADGQLVYYNESAEPLIGQRFEESGPLSVEELSTVFDTRDSEGVPIPSDQLPPSIALLQRRPVHQRISFRALDGVWRESEMTAFPLEGQGRRHLGAIVIFWEVGGD